MRPPDTVVNPRVAAAALAAVVASYGYIRDQKLNIN